VSLLLRDFYSTSPMQDPVPNIKFNVARLLEQLASLVDAPVVDHTIRPCLNELSTDADSDVRYFAKQALTACDHVAAMA
jgi:serine/threonine-protein phosphatase 2A regulatory subunit A